MQQFPYQGGRPPLQGRMDMMNQMPLAFMNQGPMQPQFGMNVPRPPMDDQTFPKPQGMGLSMGYQPQTQGINAFQPQPNKGNQEGIGANNYDDSTQGQIQRKFAQYGIHLPNGKSPFWKTRMCDNILKTGSCPFGDSCNRAHSQADQRMIPQELMRELEASGLLKKDSGPNTQNPTDQQPQKSNELHLAQSQQPSSQQQQQQQQQQYQAPFIQSLPTFPRVKGQKGVCYRFYQRGTCAEGDKCQYLHVRSEQEYKQAIQQLMQPDAGVSVNQSKGQNQTIQGVPENAIEEEVVLVVRNPTYLDKVKAVCAMLNLGNLDGYVLKNQEAMKLAFNDINSGQIFRENFYACDLTYLNQDNKPKAL